MEIHAPHQPILTVKEALVHLGIVTIGILIALSLEGLVEWQHHRNLVQEARENLAAEIRDNDKEIKRFLEATTKSRSDNAHALAYINAALSHNAPEHGSITISSSRPDLTSASWTTAQTIGALGLMNYNEVKQYAAVYELQDDFLRLESKTIDAVAAAITTFQENEAPEKLPAADLQTARERILVVLSGQQVEQQIGKALETRYQNLLNKR